MIKESKHYSNVMKKYFNKELEMNKIMKILNTLLNVVFVVYVEGNAKVRDHCHITGK